MIHGDYLMNSIPLISLLQTCSEALREANVAAAFGKPINF